MKMLLEKGTGKARKIIIKKNINNGIYYDCEIKAAYMMKTFGIRFYDGKEVEYELQDIIMFGFDSDARYYVLPESYGEYGPKVGDLWTSDSKRTMLVNLVTDGMFRYVYPTSPYKDHYIHKSKTQLDMDCNMESQYSRFVTQESFKCLTRGDEIFMWPNGNAEAIL